MSKKVKVVGYSQEVKYKDGIAITNFSDSLVGNQFTSDAGSALFTLGNFRITTNLDPKITKSYKSSQFTNYYTLNNLSVDEELNELISRTDLKLNLDPTDIRNYAYFGSFKEFMRVSLENIITLWPASLYATSVNQISPSTPNKTFEQAAYDIVNKTTTYKIHKDSIKNDFSINIKDDGTILNTFNSENKLRDFTMSYNHYNVVIDDVEYPVIGFTGYTDIDSYITLTVEGDPFNGNASGTTNYHIKPNIKKYNLFFLKLNDFERHILNRDTNFKAEFKFDYESDNGNVIKGRKTVKWPISDGYNIDFKSEYYSEYVKKLIEIANISDENKSNILANKMVSDSIFEWDTADQKMGKTLSIYGRNFDEVKKHNTGIKYANTVSYDKKNNVPDGLVKNLARTLGWELTTSLFNVDFNDNFLSPNKDMTITPVESEIEFWRRLILNSPWVWKSKGTRKVIEFLLRFIGTPKGLIHFNEYIYKASNKVSLDEVQKLYELRDIPFFEEEVVVDGEGYPKVLPNTNEMYYQKGGLWHRQTGGEDSNYDITTGNNPHVGPYDRGYAYVEQFNTVIPNFEPVALADTKIYTVTNNTFMNYDLGKFDDLLGTTPTEFIEKLTSNNNPVDDCVTITSGVIEMPKPNPKFDKNGAVIETEGDQAAFKIHFVRNKNVYENPCDYTSFSLDANGLILFTHSDNSQDYNISAECCSGLGHTPELDALGRSVCRWKEIETNPCDNFKMLQPSDSSGYVVWTNLETGAVTNVVPTSECCTRDNYNYEPNGDGFSCIDTSLIEEPTDPCENYTFSGSFDSGYAVFTHEGGTTKYVPSVECCSNNGLDYEGSGNQITCLEPVDDCNTYTIVKVPQDSTNYVTFEKPDGIFTQEVNAAECCTSNNFIAEPQDNGSFKCHIEKVELDLPKLSLVNREDGDMDGCEVMNMEIEGTPNTTVKYRITTVDGGTHGFINELTNINGLSYTPSQPVPSAGSYCEGSIKIGATGKVTLEMNTCARPPIRSTENCVELEFAIFDYDNTTIDAANKLTNRSCMRM